MQLVKRRLKKQRKRLHGVYHWKQKRKKEFVYIAEKMPNIVGTSPRRTKNAVGIIFRYFSGLRLIYRIIGHAFLREQLPISIFLSQTRDIIHSNDQL